MMPLQVIAHYTITHGHEDAVLELLPELTEASRSEPGNLLFVAYRELENGRNVLLLEQYTSRSALAAHRESKHFKEIVLNQIVPLLERRVVDSYHF